jgi:hypothetical protein
MKYALMMSRRARFALSNNQVFLIPHINDMTDEEVLNIWYEKHDYDQIKANIVPIVQQLMQGDNIEESNEITIRGLEFRTRNGAIRRQNNKLGAITAVLDEQDRQFDEDVNDPHLISQAYLEISDLCLREAQQLALRDAAFASEYHSVFYHGSRRM